MLPSTSRSVVHVMPTGLLSAMYTGADFLRAAPDHAVDAHVVARLATWTLSAAGAPLTVTRPASIRPSASRRDHALLSPR